MNSDSDKIIQICVGGRNFKTTKTTIMSDENCILAKMFANDEHGRAPASKDEKGYYFIDRSPKYFESILNFLRTGEIDASICLDLGFLLKEAEYYGIDRMAEKVKEEICRRQACEKQMQEHCKQLNCIQQCCQNYLSQIAECTARQLEVRSSKNMEIANLNIQNQQGGHHHHHHFGHFHHHHPL